MSKKSKIKWTYDVWEKHVPTVLENPNDYLSKHPSWCFSRHDKNSPRWSLGECDDYMELIQKLSSLEGMTWNEIMYMSHGNSHWINVEQFTREAQKRAVEIKLEYDSLFSLRLAGMIRLFGWIEDGVFYLIWYDPNHEICPSQKKHT